MPLGVEFARRCGDPDTEAILPLRVSYLLEPLRAVDNGKGLTNSELEWSSDFAVTTVVATAGYPDAPRKGAVISLPPSEPGVNVFHAGTAVNASGELVVTGGRVFAVTAVRPTLAEAQRDSGRVAGAIDLEGKQLRHDIGWRELERGAGATRD